MPITRRQMLKGATGTAAAIAASAMMPPNLRRVLAETTTRRSSLRDIKHVVLIMQENRSFDHYYGTLPGVRGFDDPHALKHPDGRPIFYQPDAESPDGHMLPFHLNTRVSSAQKIPSTSHAWAVQHEAWNGGKLDRWLPAHRSADGVNGPYCMGYHTREDIPFQFALAEAFTLCDAYHCSVLGPTWPNRLYWMTGTIDPEGRAGGPVIEHSVPANGFEWTTYPERLQVAGVSWRVYAEEKFYGFNMLGHFRQFREAAKSSPLYIRGLQPGPVGEFEYDAANDRLPAVSWVMPTLAQSEHPDAMPADGAAFIASKIDAIASNPDVWAKTLVILNYDENDGLFDHVPPPVPPTGTPLEFVDDLPIGGGFRVPCLLISPWSTGGWVCSKPFDHTSVLQFLEIFTGVREPNISAWRRKTFGDLTSGLRLGGARGKAPTLPDTLGQVELAKYEVEQLPSPALPQSRQKQPHQEQLQDRRGLED